MRISDWSSYVCSSDLTDTRLAARDLWQPVGLLLLVARIAQGDRRENLTGEKRHRGDRIAKLFRYHRSVEQGPAEPAMLFGDPHSGNAQIVESPSHLVAQRLVPHHHLAHLPERAGIGTKPRIRLPQQVGA